MKLSQNLVAWNNNKHLLSHTAFVGQKSKKSLAGCFCLRISHEIIVKILAEIAVI